MAQPLTVETPSAQRTRRELPFAITHLTFRFVWFAKLLIHSFSLLLSAFKAIRRVDQKVRELLFFFLRHLGFNSLLGLLAIEAITQHQALQLNFGAAVDDDQLIKPPVSSRFNHQGRIDYGNAFRILAFPFPHLFILLCNDERMQDRVEAQTFLLVSENERAELCPIEAAVR